MVRSVLTIALLTSFCASSAHAQTVVQPPQVWPGQSGNPVGYMAAPGWPGSFSATACPSSPASGTSWANATFVANCTYSNSGGNSISCSFCTFEFVDFKSTTLNGNCTSITGSNVLLLGDRFQCNSVVNANLSLGLTNLYFFYDSIEPLVSFYTSPPGSTWPSAGAGTNSDLRCTAGQTTQVPGNTCNGSQNNMVDGREGYQFGFKVFPGSGVIVIDHCDIWGYGNAIAYQPSVTTQSSILSNWIHDPANPDWSSTDLNVTSFTGTNGSLVFSASMGTFVSGESIRLFGFSSPNTALNGQLCVTGSNLTGFTSTTFTCGVSGSGYSSGAGTPFVTESYHTDGPGYLNGGVGPTNAEIIGNTVAMLGNTNALAFQSATSGYSNIIVNENFWSGDSAGTIALFQPGSENDGTVVSSNRATYDSGVKRQCGPF